MMLNTLQRSNKNRNFTETWNPEPRADGTIQQNGNLLFYFIFINMVDPRMYVKVDSMYAIFWMFCTSN